ncbi:hypothetical protein PH213_20470 [Streptomyces sp. SRF1]|uniref:hypothetical protein n=1 Tax=Streptomyces sp. SRF1 TaxID=1549642 RepID=UPI0025B06EAB|nr:hypothetical protein [Streptomyces sp. SRF1]MDN3056882.1 hypothetical protein [Streptomyces sp. SRF1]
MVTTDPTTKAIKELDRLTAAFNKAKELVEERRKPLHSAIVRHLRERNAPPGRIADHSPYDRNHIGRIGKEAGVPPIKGPNAVGPAPVYDEDTEAKALAELDELTAAFEKAEGMVDTRRTSLHDAIVKHYTARTLRPGEIAGHSPYDRNHIGRIVKAADAPRLRP